MNMTKFQKILSFVLCIVLIAAVALFTFGCNEQSNDNGGSEQNTTAGTDSGTEATPKKTFTFIVVDAEGNETTFTVSSDKKTVGDALLAEGLIEGENETYGLYVKKVNGITADYDVDGTYWAFYINGEYAMTGVDSTDIEEGATYSFKVEK
ncbi:MAG: DUF4430 domain-containing protein [Clostridia bacterium]|nr:DUF4430 domain-containing protein [Clostridia bacterium]